MKQRSYGLLALLVLVSLLSGCSSSARQLPVLAEQRAVSPEPNSSANQVVRSPLTLPLKNPRIEVRKTERRLLLYSDEKLVRTYHVGLGLSPVGDKERMGDHRTPEGEYYIFIKNPKSAFYLSLGVSYPNSIHAQRGLREGLISKAQHDQIVAAIRQKKTPLQRTRLGGDIFIHGHGASSDWTWGCVALENEDIKELYDAVGVGTPVTIKP
jgi:murein L,D-transpeptidase YafK